MTGLALSPDGKTLAVAAHGLRLWSTATGRRIGGPLPAADAGGPVAFSPDGTLVAAIGTDDKARLWNVATQQETGTAVTVGPGASQGALAFSPGGKTYATVGANGTAALWSVTTQRRIGVLMTADAQGPAGAQAAGQAGLRARVQPGRRHAGHRRRQWQHPAVGRRHPAGDRHADDGRPRAGLRARVQPGRHHPGHRRRDGSARLWDVATQQEIGTPMTAGPEPVYALAFSPDGTTLATARRRRPRPPLERGLPGRGGPAGRRLRHRGPIPHPPAVG